MSPHVGIKFLISYCILYCLMFVLYRNHHILIPQKLYVQCMMKQLLKVSYFVQPKKEHISGSHQSSQSLFKSFKKNECITVTR